MTEADYNVSRQRGLGYVCIFSRNAEEASTAMTRQITAGLMGDETGGWIELIDGWLTKGEPLAELNFGGARFGESEWRLILKRVIEELRRNITQTRT